MPHFESKPSVVVIGGGNGSSTVLEGLAQYDIDLTAIVTTTDNGGSSGQLREQYPGLIGVGDARQCLRALAKNRELAAILDERTSDGHAVGNIMIVERALELGGIYKIDDAIESLGEELRAIGSVLPVSLDSTQLSLEFPDGEKLIGEQSITTYSGCIKSRLGKLCLSPPATLNPKAIEAIARSCANIVAPGNFYSSILPPLLTPGMYEALVNSNAPLIMIGNLKNGQNTPDFTPADYISEFRRQTRLTPDIFITHRNSDGSYINDLCRVVIEDIVSDVPRSYSPHDRLAHTRSALQHCSQKLGALLVREISLLEPLPST